MYVNTPTLFSAPLTWTFSRLQGEPGNKGGLFCFFPLLETYEIDVDGTVTFIDQAASLYFSFASLLPSCAHWPIFPADLFMHALL